MKKFMKDLIPSPVLKNRKPIILLFTTFVSGLIIGGYSVSTDPAYHVVYRTPEECRELVEIDTKAHSIVDDFLMEFYYSDTNNPYAFLQDMEPASYDLDFSFSTSTRHRDELVPKCLSY